jgi:hypothetical protein
MHLSYENLNLAFLCNPTSGVLQALVGVLNSDRTVPKLLLLALEILKTLVSSSSASASSSSLPSVSLLIESLSLITESPQHPKNDIQQQQAHMQQKQTQPLPWLLGYDLGLIMSLTSLAHPKLNDDDMSRVGALGVLEILCSQASNAAVVRILFASYFAF